MAGLAPRSRSRRRSRCRALLVPGLLALVSVACATSGSGSGPAGPLKHRVAVLPFENTTDFVTGAFENSYGVPLEEQAHALLETLLRESDRVLLVETEGEAGDEATELPEFPKADYVLIGELREFGRSTTIRTQLIVDSKRQGASASVRLRLVEVRSGQVLFTSEGAARASSESARLFGMGDEAPFDASLNTEVLEDALDDPADELLARLLEQRWRTVLITTEGDEVVIAGGAEQGLRVGDRLSVRRRGREVESDQLEGTLELPSTEVARLKVTSCFGSGANHEGSTCRVVEGQLEGLELSDLIVEELR